jgi:hypothetical protein
MGITKDVRRAFDLRFPEFVTGNNRPGFLQNSQARLPAPPGGMCAQTAPSTDMGIEDDVRRAIDFHFPKSVTGNDSPDFLQGSQTQDFDWPLPTALVNNNHDNPKSSLLDAYLKPTPDGLAERDNIDASARNNPLTSDDPKGSDIMVITGGVNDSSLNVFGHIASAIGGYGMASYGTDTPLGSSVSDYLYKQRDSRTQQVTLIHATPSQGAAATAYINNSHPNSEDIDLFDNCAVRTHQILNAAGVSTRGVPFPGGTARDVQSIPGATTYIIPQHGPIPLPLQNRLPQFNRQ